MIDIQMVILRYRALSNAGIQGLGFYFIFSILLLGSQQRRKTGIYFILFYFLLLTGLSATQEDRDLVFP